MLVIGVGPLSLTACGGGDISSASSVPPPPPTATPTPTPTPAPAPIAPAHLGLVSVGPFAVLAVGDSYKTNAAGANRTQLTAPAPQDAHFSYNAATNTYQISLPDFQSGTLVQTGYDGSAGAACDWLRQPRFSRRNNGRSALVRPPARARHRSQPLLVYELRVLDRPNGPLNGRRIAEGGRQICLRNSPTGSGDVPLTGSAIYVAEVIGSSADASELSISGSATFEFNFGAGTLNGHLNPVIYDYLAYGSAGLSLGRYDFGIPFMRTAAPVFPAGFRRSGSWVMGRSAGSSLVRTQRS